MGAFTLKEKYITDNGFGATNKEAREGFSDQTVKESDNWMKKWDEEKKYKDIGFGRDCGYKR